MTNPGGQGTPDLSGEPIYDSNRSQLRQTLQQAAYRRGLPQGPDPRIHRQQDHQPPHPQLPHPQQALHFPQMLMPHMPPYVRTQPQPPVPVWPYGSPAYWQQLQQQQRQLQQSLPPHLQRPQQLPQAHNRPIQSTTRTPNQSAQPGPTRPIPPKPVAAPAPSPTSTAQNAKPTAKASATTPTPKPPTSSAVLPAASGVTNQPTPTDSADGKAPVTDGGASLSPTVVKEPVVGTGTASRGKGKGGGRGRGKSKVQADKDKS